VVTSRLYAQERPRAAVTAGGMVATYKGGRDVRKTTPFEDRFWSRVDRSGPGCWPWMGSRNQGGYGTFHIKGPGGSGAAHRIAYELVVGPIPAGLTLDHLCRNRACVNPAHLEPVTMRINVLRGTAPSALNARNEFDEVNTYWRYGKERICRACQARRHREARQRAWWRKHFPPIENP
jgi:HNH endonuclease